MGLFVIHCLRQWGDTVFLTTTQDLSILEWLKVHRNNATTLEVYLPSVVSVLRKRCTLTIVVDICCWLVSKWIEVIVTSITPTFTSFTVGVSGKCTVVGQAWSMTFNISIGVCTTWHQGRQLILYHAPWTWCWSIKLHETVHQHCCTLFCSELRKVLYRSLL